MIYMYAIGEREDRLLAYVRSGVTHAPAPEPEALERHDAMVWRLAERDGAVLPVRFGTVLSGEADVRELLARRREELRGQLAHVRGRVEIGARATWDDLPEPEPATEAVAEPATGRDFLQAKLSRRRAAERKANELHEPLRQLAVDSVLHLNPRQDTAFSAAYLVERAEVDRFARQRPEGVTLTGPWPPYSFSRQ